jgi:hypothetical protein
VGVYFLFICDSFNDILVVSDCIMSKFWWCTWWSMCGKC